jgi:hypothetical protein
MRGQVQQRTDQHQAALHGEREVREIGGWGPAASDLPQNISHGSAGLGVSGQTNQCLLQFQQLGLGPLRQPGQTLGCGEKQLGIQPQLPPFVQQDLVGLIQANEQLLAGVGIVVVDTESGGSDQAGHGVVSELEPVNGKRAAGLG